MKIEDVCIPVSASWSSPFVRWQGPAADVNSLDLARQVTQDGLARTGVEWPFRELVLGITVPQKESFYGAPTLAARLGLGQLSGPMLAQACATSVACVHWAAANQQGSREGARLVVTTDRTSNGPHLVYPSGKAPGATPDAENWVLDNFGRDPVTGEGMLATAERVAAEGAIGKEELDELAVRRYEQYLDALADDRAFQRDWMVPIAAGSRRKPLEIDEDWGVRPIVLEELRALAPVEEGGVVSYGTQTHPADGSAGMVVTSPSVVAELGVEGPVARLRSTGFARVEPGTMPKAPVPAARAALADAGDRHRPGGRDQDPQPVRRQRRLVRARARGRRRGDEPVRLEPGLRASAGADGRARDRRAAARARAARRGSRALHRLRGRRLGSGARRRGRRVTASIAQPGRRAGALRRRSVGPPAARSVLLTVLGEYVMPRGGSVWQETLVEGLVALGHTEQTARQAVARSTRDGWLIGERFGRRTRMTITPETRQMLEEGRDRIFGFGDDVPWDGRWLVVVAARAGGAAAHAPSRAHGPRAGRHGLAGRRRLDRAARRPRAAGRRGVARLRRRCEGSLVPCRRRLDRGSRGRRGGMGSRRARR